MILFQNSTALKLKAPPSHPSARAHFPSAPALLLFEAYIIKIFLFFCRRKQLSCRFLIVSSESYQSYQNLDSDNLANREFLIKSHDFDAVHFWFFVLENVRVQFSQSNIIINANNRYE
jgi:hypothetical protein